MWNAVCNAVGMTSSPKKVIDLPNTYPFPKPETPAECVELAHTKLYADFSRVMDDPTWTKVDYTDPESAQGGDLTLWSKPQEATYHYIKATFTISNVVPGDVAALVGSEKVEDRQKFGPNMEECTFFEKPDEKTALVYTRFWAPAPVSSRDFLFLQGIKHADDGTIEIWGSSVQHDKYTEQDNGNYVRGSSFWAWRLKPVENGAVFVSYFNVSDPRGWCPSFIFSYLKTQVSSDLCGIRDVLRGKSAHVHKLSVEECGVKPEDALKEEEQFERTHAHDTDAAAKVPSS